MNRTLAQDIRLARITDAKDALEFMLAGNAYLTLRSTKTGTRYTFRVKRKKDTNLWFVSTLWGSDNTSDYSYLGLIDENRQFRLSPKSRTTRDSPQTKAFEWTMRQLVEKGIVPDQLEVWHEGRCGRCGRLLTVPESIASGIGPECAKRAMTAIAC